MELERVAVAERRDVSTPLIVAVCLATFAFFSGRPLIPDIAWLIEASRRWLSGAELYRDIIEVNPPLIFYETVALTGGQLTGTAYIAGVCIVMALSALWILRLRGGYTALASLAAMTLGGLTDFGQRDHLALIFVLPFLLGEQAPHRGRIALGLWAFLGVGLKPYLLPIPLAAIAARALLARSWRPLFSAETLALAAACCVYLAAVFLLHQAYFTDIIPLGRFVYFAYGARPKPELLLLTLILTGLAIYTLRSRRLLPLAAAMLAALVSFHLQGRNWTYHFIPAVGLGLLLALSLRTRAGYALALILCAIQLWRGPHQPRQLAPIQTASYAVLSAHVYAAYPSGGHNATRYPALWVLPGAWRRLHEGDRRAIPVLARHRAIIRGDILTQRPQALYVDARRQKPYFRYPFDYMAFLGPLPGYRYAGRSGDYDVWVHSHSRQNQLSFSVPIVHVVSALNITSK